MEFIEIVYEWKPSVEEHGHSLTCRAVHSRFPNFQMERQVALNIYRKHSSTIRDQYP